MVYTNSIFYLHIYHSINIYSIYAHTVVQILTKETKIQSNDNLLSQLKIVLPYQKIKREKNH